ncbi:hypothetical protein CGLO_14117 [Colletotrichum gloeosporioides Cg-14]|uniref:Uncharacterized protein n=1 Tax=Colletotrichum gloeosporioides (strain Cg-14) TaxID=1237896 RepID=T0JUZ5_COLGC|nr:hypothetical protein CGLO_14117 [Colletotrichum gloeosporioides Cg-14]
MGSHNCLVSSHLSISVSVSDSACPSPDGLENRMRPRRQRRTRSPCSNVHAIASDVRRCPQVQVLNANLDLD